jgi:hypothetical protein
VLLALPAAAWLVHQLHRSDGRALNALLARTAQYQVLLVALYALGLLLGWLTHLLRG